MSDQLVSALWGAVVGGIVGAGLSVLYSRKALQYQSLYDLQKEYRSEEMHEAVSSLWKFYDRSPATLEERYRQIRIDKRLEDPEKRGAAEVIDGHRRLVSHFYAQLAVMYLSNTVPRQDVLMLWTRSNLGIIKTVIIPIENVVVDEIPVERRPPKIGANHPLTRFHQASERGFRTWWQMMTDGIRGLTCPMWWAWWSGKGRRTGAGNQEREGA